ncbi:hypothetical protein NKG05_05580 [Oerskovia sp. M15]
MVAVGAGTAEHLDVAAVRDAAAHHARAVARDEVVTVSLAGTEGLDLATVASAVVEGSCWGATATTSSAPSPRRSPSPGSSSSRTAPRTRRSRAPGAASS